MSNTFMTAPKLFYTSESVTEGHPDKMCDQISDAVLEGAGDQGMMFGYASNETAELMPLPVALAHKIGLALSAKRKSGAIPWLQPDGKSQVTVEYVDGKPVRIDTIVVSNQHSPDVSNDEIRKTIIEDVIKPVLPQEYVQGEIKYHINPTGKLCRGRSRGRLRPDRPQDHRRHLRRHGPPRWRRVQRQGLHQGGSQRRVHGALHGEERRGRRHRRPLRSAAGLRHRRGPAGHGLRPGWTTSAICASG
jgi:hypothetical protein